MLGCFVLQSTSKESDYSSEILEWCIVSRLLSNNESVEFGLAR